MHIAQLIRAQSMEEAWEANQQRGSRVLGGCCWLRLSPGLRIRQAVDLSVLGLDQIEEGEREFRIGAMTPLRVLEVSPALDAYAQGAVKEGLRHIVGTQFRNVATVGGSVCGRFGFSDVLTLLLALHADVELYRGGRMPLEQFAETGVGTDILTHVVIPKEHRRTAYASLRLNATDFPIIACSVSSDGESLRCAIGARPLRAQVCCTAESEAKMQGAAETARKWAASLTYGDNSRGSAAYRKAMASVLSRRLLQHIWEEQK